MDVAAEPIQLSHGYDIRKRVAKKLLQAAESGHKNLGELEAVGRKALRVARRKSA